MKDRGVVRLVVIAVCLALLVGCSTQPDLDAVNTNERKTDAVGVEDRQRSDATKTTLTNASGNIQSLLRQLSRAADSAEPDALTSNDLLGTIEPMLGKLNNVAGGSSNIARAIDELNGARVMLREKQKQNLSNDERKQVSDYLSLAKNQLDLAVKDLDNRPAPTPPRQLSQADTATGSSSVDWVWTTAKIGTVGLIAFIVLVGVLLLLRGRRPRVETRQPVPVETLIANLINKQESLLSREVAVLKASNTEITQRLGEIQNQLYKVATMVREASMDGRRPTPPAMSTFEGTDRRAEKQEEPSFPVSATDYLGKMQSFAVVVKPDFQNGILVNDPDGTGELILIRDRRVPDDTQPLFIIPRNTQFQTKQDFHTYYEKYYECSSPSAGDVWIIDPAVVSSVQGGWQLREKGLLEVR